MTRGAAPLLEGKTQERIRRDSTFFMYAIELDDGLPLFDYEGIGRNRCSGWGHGEVGGRYLDDRTRPHGEWRGAAYERNNSIVIGCLFFYSFNDESISIFLNFPNTL